VVMVPDGCRAVITRFGRLEEVVEAGRTLLFNPWKQVSYIVNVTAAASRTTRRTRSYRNEKTRACPRAFGRDTIPSAKAISPQHFVHAEGWLLRAWFAKVSLSADRFRARVLVRRELGGPCDVAPNNIYRRGARLKLRA
jgi:SPFH domain / Band 7 family